jgi:hypothetical protein
LDGEIAVGDRAPFLPACGQMLDGLREAVVADVIGRGFGAEQEMIAHVLRDRALTVVTANDGIRHVQIGNDGFELAAMACGDLPANDDGERGGLADGAVRVEEPLAERVQRGPTTEDQVVAVLDLGQKQPMLTRSVCAFGGREERREGAQPLLRATLEVTRGEGIGPRLSARRGTAREEGIAALPKGPALSPQARGEPVMLIETHPGGEGEVGTDADEQAAPLPVDQIEVVLNGPPPFVLPMPAVVLADRHQIPGGFARLQDEDDMIGVGPTEVRVDERVAPLVRGGLQDGHPPFRRLCDDHCWYWVAMSRRTPLLTGTPGSRC